MRNQARKRFGQHFLHDKSVIQQIVTAIDPDKIIPIVEIGPGKGALTIPLLGRVGTIDAIEIDHDLAAILIDKCRNIGDLRIHINDALKFDFCSLHNKKIKIVGNLPYNISTPLLFHLLNHINCIDSMLFMMQKEIVDRICAETDSGDYGRLTVMIQSQCQGRRLFNVSPEAFSPIPKVESSLISLKPLISPPFQIRNKTLFSQVVKEAFTYRRKTLRNALKNLINTETLTDLGIAPTSRAENLSVQDFVTITNALDAQ